MTSKHTFGWMRLLLFGSMFLWASVQAVAPTVWGSTKISAGGFFGLRARLSLRGGDSSAERQEKSMNPEQMTGSRSASGYIEPRHAWDQDTELVYVYVFLDGIGKHEQSARVSFGVKSLEVRVENLNGFNYLLSIHDLYSEVDASKCHYSVRADKISISMPKRTVRALWPKLRSLSRMTLEDIPILPESFRESEEQPAKQTPRKTRNEEPASESAPNETAMSAGGSKSQVEWEAKSSQSKMQVMAAEKRVLADLLGVAQKGDAGEVRRQVQQIAHERGLTTASVLNEFLDGNKRGVVHLAAAAGHQDVLKYARSAGADMAQRDANGQTSLFMAAAARQHDVVKMLGTVDCVPVDEEDGSSGSTALCHAAANGDIKMIELLVCMGAEVDTRSYLGTPLQWAAMADQEHAVERLLRLGASPDLCAIKSEGEDRNLPSPLVVAASMNQTMICHHLIEASANVSAVDNEGTTALHHAADNANAPLVLALVKAGADPFCFDANGKTPVSMGRVHTGTWFAGAMEAMLGGRKLDAPVGHGDDAHWRKILGGAATEDQVQFVKNSRHLTRKEKEELFAAPQARPEFVDAEKKKQEGNEALSENDFDKAIALYTEAIDIIPGVKEFYANRAVAYLRARKLEEALKDAQTAKELDPTWAKAHYREGQIYKAMGKLADAGVCFWEAHRLDPTSAEAKAMFTQAVDEGRRQQGLKQKGFLPKKEVKERELKEWANQNAPA